MGLAGPKRRTKIAHDPNNNNWAKSTNSFGHKILASQGWKPGDTLGAKDANHAKHYTAGSNSHIRVLLKDDNLGLGAARGGNNAETFGLSLYSGILGRLNGKSDVQVEKEQKAQRDVELALYQGRKYGHINFISAGFLVGDKIEDLKSTVLPATREASAKDTAPAAGHDGSGSVAGKKRKRPEPQQVVEASSSGSESSEDEEAAASRKSRKTKESKKRSKKSSVKESSTESADESKSKDKKRRKEKKEKKQKPSATSSEEEAKAEKKLRKAERRARKEERRRRKEQKRPAASATPSTAPATSSESVKTSSVPAPLVGRHAVRQRYIAQKRMASLNPQALKEIFMVKA